LSNPSGLLFKPHSKSFISFILVGKAIKADSIFLRSALLEDSLNLKLINFELIVSSYHDFIKLLSCIPSYHIEIMNDNNESALKILQEYYDLKNKLNFKYFSDKFLKTYFD